MEVLKTNYPFVVDAFSSSRTNEVILTHREINSDVCKLINHFLLLFSPSFPLKTRLNLSENQITPDGYEILAQTLASNTTLTDLDLQCNRIGTVGSTSLAEALKQNTTLTKLNLDLFQKKGPIDLGQMAASHLLKP
eukprot:TRINITY_DN2404_c1_g1_i1.p1 TRINITY_DN2404_c1_g1~~TRINITY_DN2404_c1_g1_i1.p1  ORF type:complete len:136 (+),score=13.48 TRINITY_DN2404_c1_g1_i1:55-462(+)